MLTDVGWLVRADVVRLVREDMARLVLVDMARLVQVDMALLERADGLEPLQLPLEYVNGVASLSWNCHSAGFYFVLNFAFWAVCHCGHLAFVFVSLFVLWK